MRTPKWPGGSQLLVQWNHHVSPSGTICPFVSKTSGPAEHEVMGRGSKHFAIRSLRGHSGWYHSHFWPLIPGSWILAIGEMAPWIGRWLRAYAAFWRTWSQPCKLLPPSQCYDSVFFFFKEMPFLKKKSYFHVFIYLAVPGLSCSVWDLPSS